MRQYIAIDLKSFYASVECVERGLNPLTTNLVVADESRTEKTICLAVSPSLKSYGISGRARLFEVVQRVKEINRQRLAFAPGREFTGSSYENLKVTADPRLALDYIAAKPRMAYYMEYSTRIYDIYLKYVAPEDMHVYSVDEVFIDATAYLNTYHMTARQLAETMVRDVYDTTGITATAGIGTNLYLAKIAMDIEAKHMQPDERGARIAELDERSYRELLWDHEPLTDFWRVGAGYQKKLHAQNLYTMGDIARCSLGGENDYYNEELLYKLFGVNAELLIDHAWGYEPCTIAEIKAYRPESNSISSGQVLQCPYTCEKARVVVQEMTEGLVLDLVEKGLVTNQMVLTVGYDIENLSAGANGYHGEVTSDRYGRKVPKHAHGTENLDGYSSSTNKIEAAVLRLYDRIVDEHLLVRRMYVVANHVIRKEDVKEETSGFEQLDLFTDYAALEKEKEAEKQKEAKEEQIQQALLAIKHKYGKNAVLRGMNFREGATARDRNNQIGGHKA